MKATLNVHVTVFALLAMTGLVLADEAALPPVRVLILTGNNNHDWKKTTPELKTALETGGRFKVDVTEHPERLAGEEFATYDVVVSNWNTFAGGADKEPWNDKAKQAFLGFVRGGKGFVVVHAGGSMFYDWPDFQKLIGATWGKGTHHGPGHEFEVAFTDAANPITAGLKPFKTKDELWEDMAVNGERTVLATAVSPARKTEPVAFVTKYGEGRCFNLVLGHDAAAMKNEGFRTLLVRGVAWAATGQVTAAITPPADPDKAGYAWQEADGKLALLKGGNILWQFHCTKEEGKPYFHPLCTGDGTVLTALRPGDHPWHRGVWWSWKLIDGLNYWEEDPKTGVSQGVSELVRVKLQPDKDYSARVELEMSYHPPGKPAVLTEKRAIRVGAPAKDGGYAIDWTSTFTAGKVEVKLDRTPIPGQEGGAGHGGYAGLSARMSPETRHWTFVNSDGDTGQDKIHGHEARWVDFSGTNPAGAAGGLAFFDHPSNLRYPNCWYANQGMPYFSPAVLFKEPYVLPAGKSLSLRYRIYVHGHADTPAIEKAWKEFSGS